MQYLLTLINIGPVVVVWKSRVNEINIDEYWVESTEQVHTEGYYAITEHLICRVYVNASDWAKGCLIFFRNFRLVGKQSQAADRFFHNKLIVIPKSPWRLLLPEFLDCHFDLWLQNLDHV